MPLSACSAPGCGRPICARGGAPAGRRNNGRWAYGELNSQPVGNSGWREAMRMAGVVLDFAPELAAAVGQANSCGARSGCGVPSGCPLRITLGVCARGEEPPAAKPGAPRCCGGRLRLWPPFAHEGSGTTAATSQAARPRHSRSASVAAWVPHSRTSTSNSAGGGVPPRFALSRQVCAFARDGPRASTSRS